MAWHWPVHGMALDRGSSRQYPDWTEDTNAAHAQLEHFAFPRAERVSLRTTRVCHDLALAAAAAGSVVISAGAQVRRWVVP